MANFACKTGPRFRNSLVFPKPHLVATQLRKCASWNRVRLLASRPEPRVSGSPLPGDPPQAPTTGIATEEPETDIFAEAAYWPKNHTRGGRRCEMVSPGAALEEHLSRRHVATMRICLWHPAAPNICDSRKFFHALQRSRIFEVRWNRPNLGRFCDSSANFRPSHPQIWSILARLGPSSAAFSQMLLGFGHIQVISTRSGAISTHNGLQQ